MQRSKLWQPSGYFLEILRALSFIVPSEFYVTIFTFGKATVDLSDLCESHGMHMPRAVRFGHFCKVSSRSSFFELPANTAVSFDVFFHCLGPFLSSHTSVRRVSPCIFKIEAFPIALAWRCPSISIVRCLRPLKAVKKSFKLWANAKLPPSCLKKNDVSLSALRVELSLPMRRVNALSNPKQDSNLKAVKILKSIWKPSCPPTTCPRSSSCKPRLSRDNVTIPGLLWGNARFAVSTNEVESS